MKIPVSHITGRPNDAVHMEACPEGTSCEIHDWPTEGLAHRLIGAMRAAHGKGGVDVCRACITRAKGDAAARLRR